MIFFTDDSTVFEPGDIFLIQSMSGLPLLPTGRTLIGHGYNLITSPGTSMPPGSVSVQYLSNDVEVAGANEEDLALYHYHEGEWHELATELDDYFNMASAPSQGDGLYALLASVRIPLYGPGWNLVAYPIPGAKPVADALASIAGFYSTVYGYVPDDPGGIYWKIYDASMPPFLNDLQVLEFGHGYWINATASVTLYLNGGTGAEPALPVALGLPPSAFYGTLRPGWGGFTPEPGMLVTAWIDGHFCGQARTISAAGEVMYVIKVWAEGTGAAHGCGLTGRQVSFQVNGQPVYPAAVWDNERVWNLPLVVNPFQVFLPFILRTDNLP
jgi:hypothetical protein